MDEALQSPRSVVGFAPCLTITFPVTADSGSHEWWDPNMDTSISTKMSGTPDKYGSMKSGIDPNLMFNRIRRVEAELINRSLSKWLLGCVISPYIVALSSSSGVTDAARCMVAMWMDGRASQKDVVAAEGAFMTVSVTQTFPWENCQSEYEKIVQDSHGNVWGIWWSDTPHRVTSFAISHQQASQMSRFVTRWEALLYEMPQTFPCDLCAIFSTPTERGSHGNGWVTETAFMTDGLAFVTGASSTGQRRLFRRDGHV
ncbi:hypothetical protein B0H13DRAFT_2372421 [Mycena leptocephala]|nr:hypothetical protein B0H13DRAFT_2372421 [Mycena leptocephala]